MFFIMGISPIEKKLDFAQTVVCPRCGRFGRLDVFYTAMSLTFFFIPLFRWDRRYFAKMSCCGSLAEIDKELGRRIGKGEVEAINLDDLRFSGGGSARRRCQNCGYTTDEDFQYCPKCGRTL